MQLGLAREANEDKKKLMSLRSRMEITATKRKDLVQVMNGKKSSLFKPHILSSTTPGPLHLPQQWLTLLHSFILMNSLVEPNLADFPKHLIESVNTSVNPKDFPLPKAGTNKNIPHNHLLGGMKEKGSREYNLK